MELLSDVQHCRSRLLKVYPIQWAMEKTSKTVLRVGSAVKVKYPVVPMFSRLGILFALLTAVLGASPGQAASPIVPPLTVYVEPALWLVPTNEAAVIITATDRNAAYAAVIAVGV
jgi:hypothetical protein